jgi:hypothetical protein
LARRDNRDTGRAARIAAAVLAERMEAHMIGPRIGNVKNDDAALIERLNSV